jgi:hypothetical protein
MPGVSDPEHRPGAGARIAVRSLASASYVGEGPERERQGDWFALAPATSALPGCRSQTPAATVRFPARARLNRACSRSRATRRPTGDWRRPIPSRLGGSRPASLYFDDARNLLRRVCQGNPSRLLHESRPEAGRHRRPASRSREAFCRRDGSSDRPASREPRSRVSAGQRPRRQPSRA